MNGIFILYGILTVLIIAHFRNSIKEFVRRRNLEFPVRNISLVASPIYFIILVIIITAIIPIVIETNQSPMKENLGNSSLISTTIQEPLPELWVIYIIIGGLIAILAAVGLL